MNEIITILQEAQNNPWTLLFISIWGIGWLMKEKLNLSKSIIPIVLPIIGMGLGVILLSPSPEGVLIGFLIALVQMGFYDIIKGAKHYGN